MVELRRSPTNRSEARSQPNTEPNYNTKPLKHLNIQMQPRATMVGVFPLEVSIVIPFGAFLIEQNDDSQRQRRCVMVKILSQFETAKTAQLPSITTQAS